MAVLTLSKLHDIGFHVTVSQHRADQDKKE